MSAAGADEICPNHGGSPAELSWNNLRLARSPLSQSRFRLPWLWRLVATFLSGALVGAGLFAQTPIAVPGMSVYADTQFRFSFWYPTAWKVTEEPVDDPTRNGWFPDAAIVKQLQIRNPAATDDEGQPTGVFIDELLAPKGLTELGRSKSPSPVGVDERYFFDSGTHRWMDTRLTPAPDGEPPGTFPLKITQRTMGGLPLFNGAVRGITEVIVPLDGSHFLAISTMDPGGFISHTYLAATVVATGPVAGKRVSERVQVETIRREGLKLQAIGVFLGYWYKDSEHVYDGNLEVLRGADPKTFAPLSKDDLFNSSFASDGVRVYGICCGVIPGADPKTFTATGFSNAKDVHHTYDWSSGSLKIGDVTAHE